MSERYIQSHEQRLKLCKICGADNTGRASRYCEKCEAQTTAEIRPLIEKVKAPQSTPNPYEA